MGAGKSSLKQLEEQLHSLASSGQLQPHHVNDFVGKGGNVDNVGPDGDTFLTSVVRTAVGGVNYMDTLQHLVEQAHASLTTFNKEGLNALHIAARDGKIDIVQFLAGRYENIDVKDDKGFPSLSHALYQKRADVARYLLFHHSADPKSKLYKAKATAHVTPPAGEFEEALQLASGKQPAKLIYIGKIKDVTVGMSTTGMYVKWHSGGLLGIGRKKNRHDVPWQFDLQCDVQNGLVTVSGTDTAEDSPFGPYKIEIPLTSASQIHTTIINVNSMMYPSFEVRCMSQDFITHLGTAQPLEDLGDHRRFLQNAFVRVYSSLSQKLEIQKAETVVFRAKNQTVESQVSENKCTLFEQELIRIRGYHKWVIDASGGICLEFTPLPEMISRSSQSFSTPQCPSLDPNPRQGMFLEEKERQPPTVPGVEGSVDTEIPVDNRITTAGAGDKIGVEMEMDRDEDMCVVCMDSKPNSLVLPCKHLCMCEGCSETYADGGRFQGECPICRGAVEQIINIFRS